jgi:cytochrome c556
MIARGDDKLLVHNGEEFMRRLISAASVLAFLAVPAAADVIEDRKAAMEERAGAMRVLGPIAQGQQDFDADAVMAALERMNDVAFGADIMDYFPEGTHEGDTRALPAIWEDTDRFVEIETTFADNIQAAIDAAPGDVDEFRAVFGPIAAQCGACHEDFRAEQN